MMLAWPGASGRRCGIMLLVTAIALTGCLGGPPKPQTRTGSLVGTVLEETYEPIAGAVVTIAELDKQTPTDAEGAFSFSNLAQGTYTLVVTKDGKKRHEETVVLDDSAVTVELLARPEGSLLENGSFTVKRDPRPKHQGLGNEYIYGWRAFAGTVWMNEGVEHVKVVERPDTETGTALRLLGHEGGYVGIRSAHMPVEPGGQYKLKASTFVEELADVSRIRVWVEFWPEDMPAETSTYRLSTHEVKASRLREWEHHELSVTADETAATATILILVHTSGTGPRVPSEAYVTGVWFGLVE